MPGAVGLQRAGNPLLCPPDRPDAACCSGPGCKASDVRAGGGVPLQDVGSRGHTLTGAGLGPGSPRFSVAAGAQAFLSVGFTFESGAGDLTQNHRPALCARASPE